MLRVVAQVMAKGDTPFKKVVVHRYSPQKPLGNELGMLNFDRDEVIRMIELSAHSLLHLLTAANGTSRTSGHRERTVRFRRKIGHAT